MNRTLGFLLVAASLSCAGCFTPMVAEAIGETNANANEVRLVEARLESLDQAVRTGNGVYYVEGSYSDGTSRIFACDPVPGVLAPGPLREAQRLPVGVEIPICSPGCEHRGRGVCLRSSGNTLLIREGNPRLQRLGTFPVFDVRVTRSRSGALLTKLAYIAALPFAVVGDATLGAAYLLFCTEAGWRLIGALLTCWAR